MIRNDSSLQCCYANAMALASALMRGDQAVTPLDVHHFEYVQRGECLS
jgi:hypothetical protein